jgi:hypothetical protein
MSDTAEVSKELSEGKLFKRHQVTEARRGTD